MKMQAWMSRVKPILTRVAAVAIEKQRETKGGILLPDGTYQSGEMECAQVFAVGPGERLPDGSRTGVDVEVGNLIWFCRVSKLQEMTYEGNKYFCVDERDIQVRIVEANND